AAAEFFRLDLIERQRANLLLLAVRLPTDARVVGRIARSANDHDQAPAKRLPMNLGDEIVEQVILVPWGLVRRLERLHRPQNPAHRNRLARRTREEKRV